MINEAEQHASEDASRKSAVEAQNLADSAVYSAEKFIQENGDKLSEAQKSSIQAEIASVKEAMGSSPETLQPAVDRLQRALQEAGTAMYQQQQASGTADSGDGSAAGGQETDEDVIEGEFSEE